MPIMSDSDLADITSWVESYNDTPNDMTEMAKSDLSSATVNADGQMIIRVQAGVWKNMLAYFQALEKIYNSNILNKGASELIIALSSGGGSVINGFNIINLVDDWNKNKAVKLSFIGDGIVASMAVPILLSGYKRYAYPSTEFMIHGVASWAFGKRADLSATLQAMTIMEKNIADSIVAKTSLSNDEITEMMSKDTYLSAQEALSKNIVDEIFNDYTKPSEREEDEAGEQNQVDDILTAEAIAVRNKEIRKITLKLMEV